MNPDASTDSDVARKQAQEALATSEARMHALLEVAVDGIISIDEPGAIQTINPAAERLFGYTQGEVIGQNVKILMPSPYLGRNTRGILLATWPRGRRGSSASFGRYLDGGRTA